MWAWLASLITGPLFNTALQAWQAKLTSDSSKDKATVDLAARELAVQQTEAQVQAQLKVAEIGHWYEPEKLFAYIVVIYFAKIVLWDKVLGIGVTDPLTGDAAKWASMIMGFYVGKRTFENVARIIKR